MTRNDVLLILLALLGMALIVGGLWWIYPPLALIGAGLSLVTFAFYVEVPEHETR